MRFKDVAGEGAGHDTRGRVSSPECFAPVLGFGFPGGGSAARCTAKAFGAVRRKSLRYWGKRTERREKSAFFDEITKII